MALTRFALFLLLIPQYKIHALQCLSSDESRHQANLDQAELIKNTCSNEKHEKSSMSCLSKDYVTSTSMCGKVGMRTVERGVTAKDKPLLNPMSPIPDQIQILCSCDSLCRFYGDCCLDFDTACPTQAQEADKYAHAQMNVQNILNEEQQHDVYLNHPVGNPDVQCVEEKFSVVVSCPKDQAVKSAIT